MFEFGDNLEIDLFVYGEMAARGNSIDAVAMDAAANQGHLDVLEYLHELGRSVTTSKKRKRTIEREKLRPRCTSNAMIGAARNGHMNVVEEGKKVNPNSWSRL